MALVDYFGLREGRRFVDVTDPRIGGTGSLSVRDIVAAMEGTIYIAGHGARNYLEHELFESSRICVEYIHYLKTPYPQLHGKFDPHVSALDLVANCGREGARYYIVGDGLLEDVRPMNPVEEFKREVRGNIERLRNAYELCKLSLTGLREITPLRCPYNFTWLGRSIIQLPQDVMAI